MSEELLINVTPMECRVALIENGTVNELYVERTVKRGLVGNIYKGKVVRVLPGMQAAFVDIGLSRTAFLHINDMVWPRSQPTPNVFELLHPGQTLTVQVTILVFRSVLSLKKSEIDCVILLKVFNLSIIYPVA